MKRARSCFPLNHLERGVSLGRSFGCMYMLHQEHSLQLTSGAEKNHSALSRHSAGSPPCLFLCVAPWRFKPLISASVISLMRIH